MTGLQDGVLSCGGSQQKSDLVLEPLGGLQLVRYLELHFLQFFCCLYKFLFTISFYFPALKKLDLASNQLKEVLGIVKLYLAVLPQLKKLLWPIDQVPGELGDCAKLKELSLVENPLSDTR